MSDNLIKFNKHHKKKKSRNNRPFPLLQFIFLCFILWGLIYAFNNIWSKTTDDEYIPFEVSKGLNDIKGRILNYDSAEEPPEKEDIWVLYQGLSDADKRVYDLFLDLAENRNGEDYTSAIIISHEKMNELEEDHLWNVYYAMCYDHPEYFYLFVGDDIIDAYVTDYDNYEVHYYTMAKPEKEDSELIKNFEKATTDFLSDIDLNGTDEEIELAIHDKLIDTVSYDYAILNDNYNDSDWDLGNTAYGALVRDSEGRPNHAVCGGYSFAFEHLLHEVGIPCAYISGSARTIPPSEYDQLSHAWNAVKISERWYEVDTTWDDQEYDEGEYDEFYALLSSYEDEYDNLIHHYYNRTTAEMENLKATDDTLFHIDGYEPYNAVNDSAHVRDAASSANSNSITVFVNSLIPVAQ
jgi:hypothetical protein